MAKKKSGSIGAIDRQLAATRKKIAAVKKKKSDEKRKKQKQSDLAKAKNKLKSLTGRKK